VSCREVEGDGLLYCYEEFGEHDDCAQVEEDVQDGFQCAAAEDRFAIKITTTLLSYSPTHAV
jgi:hypothetical protein